MASLTAVVMVVSDAACYRQATDDSCDAIIFGEPQSIRESGISNPSSVTIWNGSQYTMHSEKPELDLLDTVS
jgi:hypothetical protein